MTDPKKKSEAPVPDVVVRPRPDLRRTSPRFDVELEVSLASESNFYVGLTENISAGGLFVATLWGITALVAVMAGLAGLGDLVLTCTGSLSRNRHVGIELARGRHLSEIVSGMKMVAEGVRTTGAALALAERYQVELPIATQMAAVLDGRIDVRAGLEALMLRRQRAESDTA